MHILIIIIIVFLFASIRIFREYERGVVFRLGRFSAIKGPGLFMVIPLFDKVIKVDLRIITLDIPAQDVITKDNVPAKVDAVLYFKITEPKKAVIDVENYIKATSQVSQTSLRGVVGASSLDEILSEREMINNKLHEIIDAATDPWGIKVTSVEIKHVEIPSTMQRAIAKQAEAERMKRAKIILAEGEQMAAGKLKEAGEILSAEPIILRYLETLADAAKEQNTTILFPMEMLKTIFKKDV